MDRKATEPVEGRIPTEWRMGPTVPIWKRKGDILKLLERVLDAKIWRRIECDFG